MKSFQNEPTWNMRQGRIATQNEDFTNFLNTYNNEMLQEGVRELIKLKYFIHVVSFDLHKEIVKLQQSHTS